MAKEEATFASKVWDVLIKSTVPVSFLVGSVLVAHEIRLARIEESRFTAQDAARLRNEIVSFHNDNTPPEWLKSLLVEIRQDMKEINARLRELEQR